MIHFDYFDVPVPAFLPSLRPAFPLAAYPVPDSSVVDS